MQQNDFQKFHDGISGVMEFYGKNVSRFTLDIWWNVLKPYDLASVIDAFNRHLANPDTGQFAPKPADVIRMLQGSTQDSALRAWAKVDTTIRSIGPYVDVVFDDPLIHRVIQDMGGWISFGQRNDAEWPFIAKEFENRYRGYRSRSDTPPYAPVMIGIFSADNAKSGYRDDTNQSTLIGNHQQALRVMRGGSGTPAIEFRKLDEKDLPKAIELRRAG